MPQKWQYDLINRDGDVFSIDTDTIIYRFAFEEQLGDCQHIPMYKLDDLLEKLPVAQQGNDAQNELQEFSALEVPSPDESDTEPTTETFSTQIYCQRPTYTFVGKGVDLGQGIWDTATSLPFCVLVVCDHAR